MHRADVRGNGQYLGPDPYFDDLFCEAADAAYVSCERVVGGEELMSAGGPQTLLVKRAFVTGVVAAPNGAHFTSCDPDYGRDEAFQRAYASEAADPERWAAFVKRYLDGDEDAYQAAVAAFHGEEKGEEEEGNGGRNDGERSATVTERRRTGRG